MPSGSGHSACISSPYQQNVAAIQTTERAARYSFTPHGPLSACLAATNLAQTEWSGLHNSAVSTQLYLQRQATVYSHLQADRHPPSYPRARLLTSYRRKVSIQLASFRGEGYYCMTRRIIRF